MATLPQKIISLYRRSIHGWAAGNTNSVKILHCHIYLCVAVFFQLNIWNGIYSDSQPYF